MNENIKLLIMKAGGIICSTVETDTIDKFDYHRHFDADKTIDKIDYHHFDAEKFAVLIVGECIEVFSKDLPEDSGKMLEVVNRVCNVAEHFGVEE